MKLILVVPDGLLSKKSSVKNYISNKYKASIKIAIEESLIKKSKIFLLPANSFGTRQNEQNWAKDYLLTKKYNPNNIYVGISNSKKYLGTRDNFLRALKNGFINSANKKTIFINKEIIKGQYTLITSHLHVDRTLLIIGKLGFKKPSKILVTFARERGNIVSRLFHYRFPILNMIYEILLMLLIEIEFQVKYCINILFKKLLLNRNKFSSCK